MIASASAGLAHRRSIERIFGSTDWQHCIVHRHPGATIIAEVYNPDLYRDYINLGKMDYLYDKVDLYDTLKLIMQGKEPTSSLLPIIDKYAGIRNHSLQNPLVINQNFA